MSTPQYRICNNRNSSTFCAGTKTTFELRAMQAISIPLLDCQWILLGHVKTPTGWQSLSEKEKPGATFTLNATYPGQYILNCISGKDMYRCWFVVLPKSEYSDFHQHNAPDESSPFAVLDNTQSLLEACKAMPHAKNPGSVAAIQARETWCKRLENLIGFARANMIYPIKANFLLDGEIDGRQLGIFLTEVNGSWVVVDWSAPNKDWISKIYEPRSGGGTAATPEAALRHWMNTASYPSGYLYFDGIAPGTNTPLKGELLRKNDIGDKNRKPLLDELDLFAKHRKEVILASQGCRRILDSMTWTLLRGQNTSLQHLTIPLKYERDPGFTRVSQHQIAHLCGMLVRMEDPESEWKWGSYVDQTEEFAELGRFFGQVKDGLALGIICPDSLYGRTKNALLEEKKTTWDALQILVSEMNKEMSRFIFVDIVARTGQEKELETLKHSKKPLDLQATPKVCGKTKDGKLIIRIGTDSFASGSVYRKSFRNYNPIGKIQQVRFRHKTFEETFPGSGLSAIPGVHGSTNNSTNPKLDGEAIPKERHLYVFQISANKSIELVFQGPAPEEPIEIDDGKKTAAFTSPVALSEARASEYLANPSLLEARAELFPHPATALDSNNTLFLTDHYQRTLQLAQGVEWCREQRDLLIPSARLKLYSYAKAYGALIQDLRDNIRADFPELYRFGEKANGQIGRCEDEIQTRFNYLFEIKLTSQWEHMTEDLAKSSEDPEVGQEVRLEYLAETTFTEEIEYLTLQGLGQDHEPAIKNMYKKYGLAKAINKGTKSGKVHEYLRTFVVKRYLQGCAKEITDTEITNMKKAGRTTALRDLIGKIKPNEFERQLRADLDKAIYSKNVQELYPPHESRWIRYDFDVPAGEANGRPPALRMRNGTDLPWTFKDGATPDKAVKVGWRHVQADVSLEMHFQKMKNLEIGAVHVGIGIEMVNAILVQLYVQRLRQEGKAKPQDTIALIESKVSLVKETVSLMAFYQKVNGSWVDPSGGEAGYKVLKKIGASFGVAGAVASFVKDGLTLSNAVDFSAGVGISADLIKDSAALVSAIVEAGVEFGLIAKYGNLAWLATGPVGVVILVGLGVGVYLVKDSLEDSPKNWPGRAQSALEANVDWGLLHEESPSERKSIQEQLEWLMRLMHPLNLSLTQSLELQSTTQEIDDPKVDAPSLKLEISGGSIRSIKANLIFWDLDGPPEFLANMACLLRIKDEDLPVKIHQAGASSLEKAISVDFASASQGIFSRTMERGLRMTQNSEFKCKIAVDLDGNRVNLFPSGGKEVTSQVITNLTHPYM